MSLKYKNKQQNKDRCPNEKRLCLEFPQWQQKMHQFPDIYFIYHVSKNEKKEELSFLHRILQSVGEPGIL